MGSSPAPAVTHREPLQRQVPPPRANIISEYKLQEHGGHAVNAAAPGPYHFMPQFNSSSRSRYQFGGVDIPWPRNVTQRDLNYVISRDEIAWRGWRKETGALFNRGYHIHAYRREGDQVEDNPELQAQVEKFFKDIDADPQIRQAYSLKWQYGYCPISITREESLTLDELKQPTDPTKPIIKISGIPGDQVRDIRLGTDFSKDTYGEIEEYLITMPVGTITKDKWCHASRFLHWKEHWIDNHPHGMQRLHPLYNKFLVKNNLDNASLETVRQFTSPKFVAVPVGEGDERVTEDEFTDMKAGFKDFDNSSSMVSPPHWRFDVLQTDGGLDIGPHADYLKSTLGAGMSGSTFATFGAEGGSMLSSDANATEWYSGMGDIQRNEISPIYYELGEMGEETGQIERGDNEWWIIEFHPLWEMDAKEEAEIAVLEARAKFIETQTIVQLTNVQWTPDLIGENVVMTAPGGEATYTVGTAGHIPTVSARPLSMAQAAKAPKIDTGTKANMYKEWASPVSTLEPSMVSDVHTHLDTILNEFFEEYHKQWEKELSEGYAPASAGVPRQVVNAAGEFIPYEPDPGVNVAGQAEFSTTLEEWVPSQATYDEYQAAIDQYLVDSWSLEVATTSTRLGSPLDPGAIVDQPTIDQINARGQKLAKDLFGNQHKAVMNEVTNGLQAGKNEAEIRNAISNRVFAGTKTVDASVHKYLHTEMSEARFRTMRDLGATSFVFLTSNDERVRPDHAVHEGEIGDEGTFMPLLSEMGCRCTTIPRTVWDDVVADQAEANT